MFVVSFGAMMLADGIYLWEYRSRSGEPSCCLALSGTDICNPQTSCTRNVYTDLIGINDYITRLLGLEKSGSLSYATILTQAQYYIKHVLSSSITRLSYRYDQYRNVKFFHEMIAEAPKAEKAAKGSSASAASTTAATAAAKKEDFVYAHLVKLGLARPLAKK